MSTISPGELMRQAGSTVDTWATTWNPGKQAEHQERRYFTERAAAGGH